MKKALSLFLAILMVVTMIPMAALNVFADDNLIKTEADLVALAGKTGTYVLDADINLGDYNSETKVNTPEDYSAKPIALSNITIDGNGHTIYGYSIAGQENSAWGLFTVSGTVTLQNINFGNAENTIAVSHEGYGSKTAALVGTVASGATLNLTNISVHSTQTTTTSNNARSIGNFIGLLQGNATLINCVSNGKVVNPMTGGSAGGTGGFIGKVDTSATIKFEGCVNNATVEGGQKVGGFVGILSRKAADVDNCINNGNVTATAAQAGGFAGDTWSSIANVATNFDLNNFVNNGKITAPNCVGGVVGEANFNGHTVIGNITLNDCHNYGEIAGATTNVASVAGGFFGKFATEDNITFTNCTNNGKVTSYQHVGGFISQLDLGDISTDSVTPVLKVENCANYGTLQSTDKNNGGFVGQVDALNANVDVDNFENHGDLLYPTGKWQKYSGGFAGWFTLGSGYTFDLNGMINTGDLTCINGSATVIAAMAGKDSTMNISNVVNFGDITTSYNGGIIVGYSQANMNISNCVSVGNFTPKASNKYCAVAYDNGATTAPVFTNNYYMNATITEGYENGATEFVAADEKSAWDIALDYINENYSATWGKFKAEVDANGNTTGICFATPVFAGVQESIAADGEDTMSIRLIGTIGNTLEYSEVGFYVTLIEDLDNDGENDNSTKTFDTSKVYDKVVATDTNNGGTQVETTAKELGGEYLFALVVNAVPAEGTVVLHVQAYAKEAGVTEAYTTDVYEIIYVDGVYQSAYKVN